MTKRNNWIGAGLLALVCCLAAWTLAAAEEGGAKVTLQGEVLDLACWVAHGGQGPEHAKCAQACAKGGQPIGLLASDGTVYVLYASHSDATAFQQTKEHAGSKVEITGLKASKGGIQGLEVQSVKAL